MERCRRVRGTTLWRSEKVKGGRGEIRERKRHAQAREERQRSGVEGYERERPGEEEKERGEKGGESERVLLALACRVCLLMVIKCQAIYRACICRRLGHGTVRVAPYAR